MGMFDTYQPVPRLNCPVCGEELDDGWQGKSAANVLFVWRQGEAAPVEWRVDEEVQIPGIMAAARLPDRFWFLNFDSRGHMVIGTGAAREGIWTTSAISAVLDRRESIHVKQKMLWGAFPDGFPR